LENAICVPPPATGGAACFPAAASVELANGTFVSMANLQVNDIVRTGRDTFSRIYLFSHQDGERIATFIELSGENFKLALSPDHFLYINGMAKPASHVKIGDQVEHFLKFQQSVANVTRVQSILAIGLFNPHTLDGDLVVDGIRTTVYAIQPDLAHYLLAPLRLIL